LTPVAKNIYRPRKKRPRKRAAGTGFLSRMGSGRAVVGSDHKVLILLRTRQAILIDRSIILPTNSGE